MPPKTKLFVGKLPPSIVESELQSLFERHGEVTECSILGNYAFIHMKTEDQAKAAINKLNNYEINGYKISVERSTTEKKSGGGGGGMGGGQGGFGMGGRGRRGVGGRGGGPMRGRGGGHRPGPYDRRLPPPPPPGMDRYGPSGMPPPPSMRNGFYGDEFDPRDRRPLPPPPIADRRPLPPPIRDPYRDFDRLDYDRMPPAPMGRRSPPPPIMDRRPPPAGYGRRDDPYEDVYARESLYSRRPDPYGPHRDMFPIRRSPPRLSPPRRFCAIDST